jgi:hypothetical protein
MIMQRLGFTWLRDPAARRQSTSCCYQEWIRTAGTPTSHAPLRIIHVRQSACRHLAPSFPENHFIQETHLIPLKGETGSNS